MFCFRGNMSLLLCCGFVLAGNAAHGRQNILTGGISVRYDHQERTYDESTRIAEIPDSDGGTIVAEDVGDTAGGTTVIVVEDSTGDRQSYKIGPRISLSSTGINDNLKITYSPIINYDQLNETTDLDHDLVLLARRDISSNWNVSLNNNFFLGDDPVLQKQSRTAVVVPETDEAVVEEPDVIEQDSEEELTERYGRRRYWTNSLGMGTGYNYGPGRVVNVNYTFAMLRNVTDAVGGYTEYDRHTGVLGLSHRFNQKWSSDGEARVSRGLFDEPNVVVVTVVDPENNQIEQVAGNGSDDLTEYNFRIRGGYDAASRWNVFTEYSYLSTDYDAVVREDYQVNNIAFGVNYDISQRLHAILSGGPSWGSFENGPTDGDYNANVGLTWDYMFGNVSLSADKSYDQSNYDGRRSGLTDSWRTGISLNHQLTQDLTMTISASYRNNRRLQIPTPQTIVIIDDGQPVESLPSEGFDQIEYTEKDYDGGVTLDYTFLRWYTLSTGYRYYDHDTDRSENSSGSYYEHRAFIQLAVSQELLQW